MPHGHCFFWRGEIVWLHVISDALIALAYFSIPLMLLYFRKNKKDLPYPWIFALFAGFIFWCGTTHIMNIVTLWIPVYRADGVVKFITASISVLTAIMLFPLIPQALSLRSPKELEKKNQELEKANLSLIAQKARTEEEIARRQDLETFTHIASHDLREPLRTISLFSDLLQDKLKERLDDEERGYIGHILTGTNRMTRLIESLGNYARLDNRGVVEESCIRTCLDRALENLSLSIAESGAEITPTFKKNEAKVAVVPAQITQLFQNLIANAIKFRQEGVPLQIQISATKEDGSWVFTVSDNGIGFEAEYHDQIFMVFKRLHTGEEKYPGTGMGLAICKRVLEQHNGTIWAESVPGQGSKFSFRLPA